MLFIFFPIRNTHHLQNSHRHCVFVLFVSYLFHCLNDFITRSWFSVQFSLETFNICKNISISYFIQRNKIFSRLKCQITINVRFSQISQDILENIKIFQIKLTIPRLFFTERVHLLCITIHIKKKQSFWQWLVLVAHSWVWIILVLSTVRIIGKRNCSI